MSVYVRHIEYSPVVGNGVSGVTKERKYTYVLILFYVLKRFWEKTSHEQPYTIVYYYNNFIEHCGVFCELQRRIAYQANQN